MSKGYKYRYLYQVERVYRSYSIITDPHVFDVSIGLDKYSIFDADAKIKKLVENDYLNSTTNYLFRYTLLSIEEV